VLERPPVLTNDLAAVDLKATMDQLENSLELDYPLVLGSSQCDAAEAPVLSNSPFLHQCPGFAFSSSQIGLLGMVPGLEHY
jgi:hypothetical protein